MSAVSAKVDSELKSRYDLVPYELMTNVYIVRMAKSKLSQIQTIGGPLPDG